jgi:hypothetical protein
MRFTIEVLEKMPMKPAGRLKNGKHFYSMVHHPAHNTFSAQDHMEAAKHFQNEGIHAQQKMAEYSNDTEFAHQHVKSLLTAAKAHAEAARAKGLPKHNNPPKR